MGQLELERTYLAKSLPEGMFDCEYVDLVDIYVPEAMDFPTLRIRKRGARYEITKKIQLDTTDASQHTEMTIPLTEAEFAGLATVKGKRVTKRRFFYPYMRYKAEIDVFTGDLTGLVLVDFEFPSIEEMQAFEMPEFCLADVTQEDFIAGGKLAGKIYSDMEGELGKFSYGKLL